MTVVVGRSWLAYTKSKMLIYLQFVSCPFFCPTREWGLDVGSRFFCCLHIKSNVYFFGREVECLNINFSPWEFCRSRNSTRSYLFTYARLKSRTGYLLFISPPGWILFIEQNQWLKGYPIYLYIIMARDCLKFMFKKAKIGKYSVFFLACT